jgi:hypothetical protein
VSLSTVDRDVMRQAVGFPRASSLVERKDATYERAMAASIFESTPSCAKITVPEG